MRKVIFAIGGNSLIPHKNDEIFGYDVQRKTLRKTVENISYFINKGIKVAITHGNGPQVGYHLLRNHYASKNRNFPELPLDICNALTQSEIGYMIIQEIKNFTQKEAITLLTRVEVSKDDPAFSNPTKPIGPFYNMEEKKILEKETNWSFKEIEKGKFRRVVPSPQPLKIIEANVIKELIDNGITVVSCGGGGIPVIKNNDKYEGIAAVIDKDRASALLGKTIEADTLIISTNIDAVYIKFNTPQAKKLTEVSIDELEKYLNNGEFGEGSMKPKIEAAISFLKNSGERVIITSPDKLIDAFNKNAGTHIHA